MAQTVGNVTAGKPAIGGAIWRAAKGTTLPSDATTALAAAFKALGYCSEDGLTNASAPSTSFIRAWGKDIVLTLLDEKNDNFQVTLIEALNDEVLKAVYGSDKVSGTLSTGLTVEVDTTLPEEGVWVVDMIMNSNTVKRIVIPHGVLTDLADITYSDSDAVGYGVTITAMPDATGKTHYEYIKQTT